MVWLLERLVHMHQPEEAFGTAQDTETEGLGWHWGPLEKKGKQSPSLSATHTFAFPERLLYSD